MLEKIQSKTDATLAYTDGVEQSVTNEDIPTRVTCPLDDTVRGPEIRKILGN